MTLQNNTELVALLNRRDDIERPYRGGQMPRAIIRQLSELRFAIQKEWDRLTGSQKS